MLSFVRSILHPSSANNGIDSRGCSISLKWNAVFAFIESSGISNAVVATDSMDWLFAQTTSMMLWLFFSLLFFGKKCPVAAESAAVLMIVEFSSIVSRAVLYRFLLLEEGRCDWVIVFFIIICYCFFHYIIPPNSSCSEV
jgi:hypothetical protein